jgi:hypothetical protein
MQTLKDNEPTIVLAAVIALMVTMAIAFAPAGRMGQEWAFHSHSVHQVLASLRGSL